MCRERPTMAGPQASSDSRNVSAKQHQLADEDHHRLLTMSTQNQREEEHRHQQEDEEEDSLSLSDLPISSHISSSNPSNDSNRQPEEEEEEEGGGEDFEFKAFADNMCAADELFFMGQLLPLGSRSESLDRCSSFATTTSSSRSMSRSHSTDSSTSTGSDQRRLSISSNFYAHPSPKPGIQTKKKTGSVVARRRSAGGSVGLFGVARAPEIEIVELRRRRGRGEKGRKAGGLLGLRESFSCSCSVGDVVEPEKKKKVEGRGGASCRRSSRIFRWLEDLHRIKDPVA